jgi:hypothetical protein
VKRRLWLGAYYATTAIVRHLDTLTDRLKTFQEHQ